MEAVPWMIVATPINEANDPTAMKPAFMVCHTLARNACTKKYAPPRYTAPSVIGVIGGAIFQANSRSVSPGKP
jgi:hypothetical protein